MNGASEGERPLGEEPDCLFCAIARGDAEASVVYDDGTVLAFMDLQPVTPGHLLVVPRAHVAGLTDLDPGLGTEIWRVGHQLALALRRSTLRCEGINVFLADGEAAFQEIFHLHLHVFPRFRGDDFRLVADWYPRERAELDATAAAVRAGVAPVDGEFSGP
ncbi:HIT family protein [Streptomyces litchfieldiae]|uniref:HIT family protein n=1 Tax=Streptomyces litchfieldiae TaxID=3075543 RepID=A0ABU2MTB7_9ACTN|nr:HIT family protein [Streptomyces sp. DSM 44938]MDT0344775.1 HIT family protein [Streptomyces sp. DSM 44938]